MRWRTLTLVSAGTFQWAFFCVLASFSRAARPLATTENDSLSLVANATASQRRSVVAAPPPPSSAFAFGSTLRVTNPGHSMTAWHS